ncbi:MAG: hypothetical protein KGZ88_02025 [Methylomicrobium sp.]|nr:hypothetical protein [Methylomicrobium sp.]
MKKNIFLKVLIFSCDPPRKVLKTINNLLSNERDDIQVILVTSSTDYPTEIPLKLKLIHILEKSVYHLRSHIGHLAEDSEWILILEDHNHVDSAYIEYVYKSLKSAPENVLSVYGPLTNKQTINSWSYANFIITAGKLWFPIHNTPDELVFFNVAYRSKFFAQKKYQLGEFEAEAFQILQREKIYEANMIVDHYQYRNFPFVMFYHFCNGRASGSFCEKSLIKRINWSLRHANIVTRKRFLELKNIINTHRQLEVLPPYLEFQLWILCMSHALGAIYGAFFGVGKALKFLE